MQAEFSLTQMLDRPVTGRIFLEQMIRDNLDIGRPDKISLIFGRRIHNGRKRPTRSEFRTRIVTDNVTPAVRVEYKHSKVKQYHKEGRALRTETPGTRLSAGASGRFARGTAHEPGFPDH